LAMRWGWGKVFFSNIFFILGLILGWIGSVPSNFISFGILKPKPDIFLKDFLINLFNFFYFFDFFFEKIFSRSILFFSLLVASPFQPSKTFKSLLAVGFDFSSTLPKVIGSIPLHKI